MRNVVARGFIALSVACAGLVALSVSCAGCGRASSGGDAPIADPAAGGHAGSGGASAGGGTNAGAGGASAGSGGTSVGGSAGEAGAAGTSVGGSDANAGSGGIAGSGAGGASGNAGGGASGGAGASGAVGGSSGASGASGASGSGGSGGASMAAISVAATSGTLSLAFDATIAGAGTSHLGAISFASDQGTVVLDGQTLPVALYEHQPWASQSLDLFQGIAVLPDRWFVLWLYCENGALTDVYYEGTLGPTITSEGATGTCAFTSAKTTITPAFPAVDMAFPMVESGLAVTGADITMPSGLPGSVNVKGTTWAAYPFSVVDCTACAAAGMGWYELHTVLWDAPMQRAAFSIFYLFQTGTNVQMDYSISLPDLGDPGDGLQLPATWTKG